MSNELSQEEVELKAELLADETPMGGFANRLEENLTKRDVPAQFGFAALMPVLIELLMEIFSSCFGENSDKSLAKKLTSPSAFHKISLRTKIRVELFNRNGRRYRNENGKEMVSALLATGTESTSEEALELVQYMRAEEIPTSNDGWVL